MGHNGLNAWGLPPSGGDGWSAPAAPSANASKAPASSAVSRFKAIFSESSASDSDRGNRRKKSPSPVRTSGGNKKAKTGARGAAGGRRPASRGDVHH